MDSVSVRFVYTEAEQVRASRIYYEQVMGFKKDAIGVGLAMALGPILIAAGLDPFYGICLMSVGGIALLLMGYAYYIRPRQRFREDPLMENEFYLVFEDSGIQFQTKGIDSRIGWNLYHRILRDNDLILLQHGKRQFTAVPIRAFASKDDQTRFEQMAARNISQQSRPINTQGH